MIRTKLMLLGLCAALFGVMAFGASGAQAAKWLILTSGGVAKTGEELKAEVGGTIVGANAVLHTEILKIKFLVVCTGFNTKGIFLEGAGKVTEGGRVEFTGCSGETNGSPNANCKPKAGGAASGTVLTNEGKGQLVLHEAKEGLTRLEPKTGTAFATLEMSEACPVGEKVPINGVLYLKDCSTKDAEGKCQNKVETHLEKHLIVEGPLTHLYATNTDNAEHAASILGTGSVFLTSTHKELAWSGMPE
jgi:hypothetical protein